jgi:predicted dehydrogenase
MAAQYLSVYRDLDWVQVVSCVSGSEESARRAADSFSGPTPISTTDFAAALAPDVDAVVINTPNSAHAEQAIAAIRAGKHVLLQKPIAARLADAEAIARAAAESDKTIGVYMSYFDQPLIHSIRGMIEAGNLGEIVHLYARLMHRGGVMWSNEALAGRPTWRGSLAETGGGCFIQLAVHFIRTFEWMTGSRVIAATGMTNRLHSPGIEGEDIACAVLRLESGALITLDMAWCSDGEEIAVHGTHGRVHYRANKWLSISSRKSKTMVEAFGGPIGAEEFSEVIPPAVGDASNPLNQHRVFLEAARDGRPAYVAIADGVHDLRVVEAVYESTRTGRLVEIRDSSQAPQSHS